MKKIIFSVLLILFLVMTADNLHAQYNRYFELSGYASLNNSYRIGSSLQDWMNDDIRSGSPAFFSIGATSYNGVNPFNTFFIGVDLSVTIPPSHSIWGSNLYFGGRNELVLNPYTLTLGMPFRLAPGGKSLSVTFEPALLMAMLTGKFSTSSSVNVDGELLSGTFNTSMGSMGIGFGLSLGAEYALGPFGIGVRYGARVLKSSVYFNNNKGGAWSPGTGDDDIKLDLGGSYLTVGAMLRFGKKNSED